MLRNMKLPQNLLPEELIVEVLSRLPVNDLMRLRCVCKSWTLITSDTTFIKLHFRRSASRNPHLWLQCKNQLFHPKLSFISFHVNSLIENTLTKLPDELIHDARVVGSCNGLICLHGYSKSSDQEHWLCFWNPATRLITEKLGYFHSKCNSFLKFAFGYDNSTNAFKVVLFDWRFDRSEKRVQARVFGLRIFTLGCNLWRDVQNLPSGVLLCGDEKPNDGVNLRGTLNWLVRHKNYDDGKIIPLEQCVILSFDLGTETFTQFSMPSGFDEMPSVGALMDRLCVSHVWKKTHYVIWQMKEFGLEKSWTQLLKIQFQDPFSYGFRWFPVCFYNGDTLIFSSFEHTDQAILYNIRDNRVERIRMTNVSLHSLRGYVESLFSPYGE